jgi:hypothetical protein
MSMFPFEDPTGTGFLQLKGALNNYRASLNSLYVQFARMPHSAFTLLDAFDGVPTDDATVAWIAYPRLAQVSDAEIDAKRFELQDEYVEWRVEKDGGKIIRITFTTEFPDYYASVAQIGADALMSAVKDAIPGAEPTNAELFGANFNPEAATPEQRAMAFSNGLLRNPWNNGRKGILVLSHPSNTLPALFGLVSNCAILTSAEGADAICAKARGSCVPGRNSDPFVCEATQNAVRNRNVLTLKDPAGVQIKRLRGIWKIGGNQVDINDDAQNRGVWKVSRNGHRALLDMSQETLTIGDDPIVNGAQIATQLEVGATLVVAEETKVPAWARTGQESSRRVG